jgi:uncharacterized protein (DUF1810 family)
MAAPPAAAAVLERIRAAQDHGLDMTGTTFAQALAEISAGRKRTHWIWYVWPSLAEMRPRVMRPEFLLPDTAAARAYLRDDVLRSRLIDVTEAATRQMRAGVPPARLFGKMHEVDTLKFHEVCTCFCIAARHEGMPHVEACFHDALDVLRAGMGPDSALPLMHAPTVALFDADACCKGKGAGL